MAEYGAEPAPGASLRHKTMSNPYLRRLQRRHFLLFDVLPIIGTAAALGFWPSTRSA